MTPVPEWTWAREVPQKIRLFYARSNPRYLVYRKKFTMKLKMSPMMVAGSIAFTRTPKPVEADHLYQTLGELIYEAEREERSICISKSVGLTRILIWKFSGNLL